MLITDFVLICSSSSNSATMASESPDVMANQEPAEAQEECSGKSLSVHSSHVLLVCICIYIQYMCIYLYICVSICIYIYIWFEVGAIIFQDRDHEMQEDLYL